MGWVYRDADQHKCPKPGYDAKIKHGDIWQCDHCKKTYKVIGTTRGRFDQREGWYGGFVSYREIETLDHGVTSWRDQ